MSASLLAAALASALGQSVARLDRVAGGDLNDAFAATLADGSRAFVKASADPAAAGSFAAEAAGLRWLAEAAAVATPEVLAVADEAAPGSRPRLSGPPPSAAPRFLALRWIEAGPATPAGEEALGRGIAALHAAVVPAFGGPADSLRIGPLALPNEPARDWPSFYAQRRLEPLARLARDRGALPAEAPALLDRLIARLPQLTGPPEPPARVHGDLWGGNVLIDVDQRPLRRRLGRPRDERPAPLRLSTAHAPAGQCSTTSSSIGKCLGFPVASRAPTPTAAAAMRQSA
jgi:fructosamine-3-kinase